MAGTRGADKGGRGGGGVRQCVGLRTREKS